MQKYIVDSSHLCFIGFVKCCFIFQLKKKEVSEIPSQEKVLSEVSSLENSKLFPFLLEKIKVAGFESQLCWLQEQLLEAAYVRLGKWLY